MQKLPKSPKSNLWFEIGSIIKLPIMVVRKRRRGAATKLDAIGGVRGMRDRGDGRGFHSGEELLGARWGPAGGGVGESAAPLEDEGQGGESEREEGEKEEELGSEGL